MNFDADQVGMPTPVGWQVQKFRVSNPKTGAPVVLVKALISVPSGLFTPFFNADDAQRFGAALRKAGKEASTGLWIPDQELSDGSVGISDPFAATGPMAPSSGLQPPPGR